jgi:hypothetical protein
LGDQYRSRLDHSSAHGFAGTEYTIMDTVGIDHRATLADLQRLQSKGWDIAVHANTDLHHFARYPALSATVVEDDMVDARAWLIEHGFKGFDHCAYPGGDFTGGPNVLQLADRYFSSCRTIYNAQRETYPPSDRRKLRVFYITSAVTLAQAEQAVDAARAAREWLIVVFHEIVPTPTKTIQWPTADYATLVEYVAASGIAVKPVTKVLPGQ